MGVEYEFAGLPDGMKVDALLGCLVGYFGLKLASWLRLPRLLVWNIMSQGAAPLVAHPMKTCPCHLPTVHYTQPTTFAIVNTANKSKRPFFSIKTVMVISYYRNFPLLGGPHL